MQQKYVYAYNGIVHWFKGLGLQSLKSRVVNPYHSLNHTYVWRNSFTQGYKMGVAYKELPMDLSNYLFIRTRERLLLENKVHAPAKVMKAGKANLFTKQTTLLSLKNVSEDLKMTLPHLYKSIYVATDKSDLPVAFASNALYVLERNGAGNKEDYERVLLPVLRKKIEYLHAEGVAQTAWALANAEIWDSQVWEGLKKHIANKSFNYTVVANLRWTSKQFQTYGGSEHFLQSELSHFAEQLFFRDRINLFELYNGLVKAHAANKDLGLSESISSLEGRYSEEIKSNKLFQEIERTNHEEQQRIADSKSTPQHI